MSHTLSGLPPSILAELSETWPEYSWDRAVLRHGAFHTVVMLDHAVFRLRSGRNRRAAIDAEVAAMRTLTSYGLAIRSPRVISAGFHAKRWSAFATTVLPGTPMESGSWANDRAVILPLVECLRSAAPPPGTAMPTARQWCGGLDFADLVEEVTAALVPQVRTAARDAVITMLHGESGDQLLLHGDFGPHNILVDGREPGLIDPDNLCLGDEAIDVAPLLGFYPVADLVRDLPSAVVARAVSVKRTLPLQVAVAAQLAGDARLRDHALGNFAARMGSLPGHSGP